MLMMLPVVQLTTGQYSGGRWVSEAVYADIYALSRQTLTNWRYEDRKAGRNGAREGFPVYRRFGRAVRYWVPN